MLSSFIINTMDTFNIIYLWTILSKKNTNIFKVLVSIFISSFILTVMEEVGLNFIFIYITYIIIVKIIFKADLKEVMFGLLVIVLTMMIFQLILTIIINQFIDNYIIESEIIESIIMILVVLFSKVKSLKKYVVSRYYAFQQINNSILTYFILICSVYVVFLKFLWSYDNGIIQNNLFITCGVIIILAISHTFTYLYFAKAIKEKEKLKIVNEYDSIIQEIVQEIKQRQHDFVNYKNTIKGIVNVVDKREVRSAITKYIKDEDIYDDKINSLIYIDNVVIRSIVYRNICKFKKHNINFKYEIENNVLDDILTYNEMSNLLNNLLNNAFEEVKKEECIKKNIELKIFNKNKISHFIIKNQVVNPNEINLNELFKRGYSTKNSDTRGYGLYNVQAIINSHKGHIKINVECGEIIFDVYFNNSSG